jgi:hypothetical protein
MSPLKLHLCFAAGVFLLAAAAPPAFPRLDDGTRIAVPADLVRTELDIAPDLGRRRLSLRATLTLDNLRWDAIRSLADWYTDVRVRSRASATFERRTITVHVAEPAADEQLVFDLAGAPGRSEDEARDVLSDSSLFLLWSDRFYPADFDDWAIMRGRVSLPEEFRLLAPGRPVSGDTAGGARTWEFETSQPIRLATIIADGRWIESDRLVNGWRVRTLLHPGSERWADQIAATSSDVLAFYQERFGPYAFDGFTFATVEGIFARRSVAGCDLLAGLPGRGSPHHRTRRARDGAPLVVWNHGGAWPGELPVDGRVWRLRRVLVR